MPETKRPLTDFDRQCILAFQTWERLGRPEEPGAAARALEIPRHTFSNRLLKFFLRGLGDGLPFEMQPGMEVKGHSVTLDGEGNVRSQSYRAGPVTSDEPFEVPDGMRVHGGTYQVGPDGHLQRQWLRIKDDADKADAIQEAARLAAETYAGPAAPLPRASRARAADPDRLNCHLLPDLHIGLHTSGASAQIDWSLGRAVSAYREAFRDLFADAPPAESGLILGGGDLLHADDPTRETRASGHRLEVAEPYEVVLAETEKLMVYKVDLALQVYPHVTVRILRGNHDPDSAVAVGHYLAAWFRSEPRVNVILSPKPAYVVEHGACMVGFTHGHELRIERLPGVMASDYRPMWGRCRHVYAHGFHVHHKSRAAGVSDSVPWETHQAPVPRDDYHEGYGYRGPRSLPVISYHKAKGEKGRILHTL